MSLTQKSIIIFTRYPEQGKTKTRLIPAIGAEKAADLQRQMTEKTISTVAKLKKSLDLLEINIFFNGGNFDLMEKWLGNQYNYQRQIEGDLGFKMYSAFQDIFDHGSRQAVIIGIDCPQLSIEILNQAFISLNDYDMVIGPADDGGYYLLGLNNLDKPLFDNINWGSDQVFCQTIAIAQQLNYKIDKLPVLKDIDRPKDLKFWHNET